jgi:hypothetical protein
MPKQISIGLVIFLLVSGPIMAQTIITDRPDQTESSSTVSQGSLQIETGILIGFSEANDNSERQLLAPTTLFRYGITKGIELRILSQFESVKDDFKTSTGISDLEIGAKIQLVQNEDVNTEIAFLSHLILPTGSSELSLDRAGTINKLSISHELSKTMGLGYNVGYDYFGIGQGNLTYSMALGIGINNKVGVYIEPYGQLTDFDKHEMSFDAGVAYLINKNVQLDFSFGTGLNHTMNYISVGTSINLPKSEKSE